MATEDIKEVLGRLEKSLDTFEDFLDDEDKVKKIEAAAKALKELNVLPSSPNLVTELIKVLKKIKGHVEKLGEIELGPWIDFAQAVKAVVEAASALGMDSKEADEIAKIAENAIGVPKMVSNLKEKIKDKVEKIITLLGPIEDAVKG
ncbi:hypothetical protein [Desulfosediminicola flagellatus]|uniref:hypothetical protein n=1 Tax=Desulfosediminicola flagellatus TaxID=2569541 RepID=UPI0010AC7830|nr:hypothetical protein [Desulfosediminicola flagellatus]